MPAKGGRYHHGDLRSALVDAAIGVIAERGVRDFSMAEASRRLGVTTAAPYRHFADRDELLAAVAARGLAVFAAMLSAAADAADPAQRLAAMAGAYVRFAAEQRPLFDALFSSGLDKSRHPELQRAWEPVDALLTTVPLEVCDGDPAAAEALSDAIEASAHGYAMLLNDGEYGDGPDAVSVTAEKAIASARALIAGRRALRTKA
jgi:AcrR family transcriptional regulator